MINYVKESRFTRDWFYLMIVEYFCKLGIDVLQRTDQIPDLHFKNQE